MTPAERIAHDIICILKYGNPGGSASTSDVKRVADYMERAGLVKPPILIKTSPVICAIPPPPPIFKLP